MSRVPASRYVLFTLTALVGLAADLWTKHAMFAWPKLRGGGVHWLVEHRVGFQLSLNEGALFGMGQGAQPLFAALSVAAALAIPVWLFYYGAAADRLLTLALGGVMAGVLGNLYDRLGLHGLDWGQFNPARAGESVHAVRDFILLVGRWTADPSQRVVWPNFNVADSLLVVGAGVLLLRALVGPAHTGGRKEDKDVSNDPSAV